MQRIGRPGSLRRKSAFFALTHSLTLGSLLIPMMRAHRGGLRSWTRAAVLPVEGADLNDLGTISDDVGGALAIATAGGEMAELFTEFCRSNLTVESWDFIQAALRYEITVSAARKSILNGPAWRHV